ncbi:hypothetical protein EWM64_g1348, partial [Hericium alpestre]
MPWTEAAIALINASGLGTVVPSSWMLSEGGKVVPFEYVFQRPGEGNGSLSVGEEATLEILDDVFKVIQNYDLGGVLGLCSRPAGEIPSTLEFTVGRANINILNQATN